MIAADRHADRASAVLTVDLDALAANYHLFRREAAGAEVAPVVKADGYGLGAAEVSRRLHAEGARSFFVARLSEGEALRRALGPHRQATIYVLDGAAPGACDRLVAADLVPVLNSLEQVEAWSAAARGGALPAALHIDTGMNRLGVAPAEAEALAVDPTRLDGIELRLVMSHLSCAPDEENPLNRRQHDAFARLRTLFPGVPASLANSAGVFLHEGYGFDMVRAGVSLYGGGPDENPDARLKPVATFEAPVLQVRRVAAGETVGYGASFTAERDTVVATLAAGYADGILRAGAPHAWGFIGGVRCPYVGRISMDLCALDVTEAPGVRPGQMAQLLGPDVPIDEAAGWAGTLAYELLVRLGTRAERRYLGCA